MKDMKYIVIVFALMVLFFGIFFVFISFRDSISFHVLGKDIKYSTQIIEKRIQEYTSYLKVIQIEYAAGKDAKQLKMQLLGLSTKIADLREIVVHSASSIDNKLVYLDQIDPLQIEVGELYLNNNCDTQGWYGMEE